MNSLETRMLEYASKLCLFDKNDKILIAASGGLDSTVLCHILYISGISFGIAHCNFQLRGKESDEDELFGEKLAKKYDVPFYSIHFDTEKVAKENGESIQLTARNLRYEWLFGLVEKENYTRLATAHHLNDSVETVLFNFSKGCGLRGLHGILPQNRNVIRPLLFAKKEEIQDYAATHNVEYREDASNESDKYSRNLIRHKVIPVLRQLNPSFLSSASETIERLKESEDLFNYAVEAIKEQVLTFNEGQLLLNIDKLKSFPAVRTIIYELLKEFGFNNKQTSQIAGSLDGQPGKQFLARNWQVVIDREHLILSSITGNDHVFCINSLEDTPLYLPDGEFLLEISEEIPQKFPDNKRVAWMDMDKVKFPLTLRHWREGDNFQPLGMKGRRQKIQDYFTHQKLSRPDKDKIWLLESDGKICWVLGYRLDERFKVSKETSKCLIAIYEPLTFAFSNLTTEPY